MNNLLRYLPVRAVLAAIGLIFFAPEPVLASPLISAISGNWAPNGVVQITGTNFGPNGPQIVLFDDFEDVAVGNTIPLTSPRIGQWTRANNSPIAHGFGRSGSRSFTSAAGAGRQLLVITPEKHKNIFISYWVRLEPDTYFPGSNWPDGRTLNTFPSDSAWKYVWFMEDGGYKHDDGKFDMVAPSYTGSGQHQSAAGNAASFTDRWIGSGWFNWDNWMRVSFTMRDPDAFPESSLAQTHIISRGKTPFIREHLAVNTMWTDAGEPLVNQLNVPGWVKNSSATDVNPIYDDVYFAVGPGASSRVELSDSEIYENSQHIELLLVESWSSTEISARVPRAVELSTHSPWYLFVTHADGTRNGKGFLVNLNLELLMPPSHLKVQ